MEWKVAEFDQSILFHKIYTEEYDTLGGEPYACIVAAYYIGRVPEDIDLLERISNIGAACHCPFILGVTPEMFNCTDFGDLAGPQQIAPLFNSDIYSKWLGFRDSQDSRFVGLVMPRI